MVIGDFVLQQRVGGGPVRGRIGGRHRRKHADRCRACGGNTARGGAGGQAQRDGRADKGCMR